MFRSVRDLEVHICMRSSDAYLLCKLGCKYMFFQSWSYYIENMASRSPKTWCRTHFHVLVGTLPLTGTRLLYAHLQFRPQKCRKPVKLKKIRYVSVITQKSVILKKSKIDFQSTGCVTISLHPLATITHAYFQLYMLSTTRMSEHRCYGLTTL